MVDLEPVPETLGVNVNYTQFTIVTDLTRIGYGTYAKMLLCQIPKKVYSDGKAATGQSC